MSLKDKIDIDYKNALKSKNKIQISTYRLILSGIKDLDISNRSGPEKKDTNDEDIKKLWLPLILYDNTDQKETTRLGEYGNGEWGTSVLVSRDGEFTRQVHG